VAGSRPIFMDMTETAAWDPRFRWVVGSAFVGEEGKSHRSGTVVPGLGLRHQRAGRGVARRSGRRTTAHANGAAGRKWFDDLTDRRPVPQPNTTTREAERLAQPVGRHVRPVGAQPGSPAVDGAGVGGLSGRAPAGHKAVAGAGWLITTGQADARPAGSGAPLRRPSRGVVQHDQHPLASEAKAGGTAPLVPSGVRGDAGRRYRQGAERGKTDGSGRRDPFGEPPGFEAAGRVHVTTVRRTGKPVGHLVAPSCTARAVLADPRYRDGR